MTEHSLLMVDEAGSDPRGFRIEIGTAKECRRECYEPLDLKMVSL